MNNLSRFEIFEAFRCVMTKGNPCGRSEFIILFAFDVQLKRAVLAELEDEQGRLRKCLRSVVKRRLHTQPMTYHVCWSTHDSDATYDVFVI